MNSPFPSPGDLPTQGLSWACCVAGEFFTAGRLGEPLVCLWPDRWMWKHCPGLSHPLLPPYCPRSSSACPSSSMLFWLLQVVLKEALGLLAPSWDHPSSASGQGVNSLLHSLPACNTPDLPGADRCSSCTLLSRRLTPTGDHRLISLAPRAQHGSHSRHSECAVKGIEETCQPR